MINNKIYLEMNDKERQYTLIAGFLDYALSTVSEGVQGTGEYNIKNHEVIELQNEISSHLCIALEYTNELLKSVQGRREANAKY